MVLSQAREIIATYGGATALAVAATTVLTGGDRGGAHRRRLAGRPLRCAARDVRGARAGAGAAGCC